MAAFSIGMLALEKVGLTGAAGVQRDYEDLPDAL
jgi:hypothetical protein